MIKLTNSGTTDFGMPTLIELPEIEDCAALCSELGLRFIELNMNLPQYQLNRIDLKHLRSVADKYGIYYTIHLDENLNPGDFNPYIADAYRRTARETIAAAKILNIPVLNMHLSRGVHFTLPEKKVFLFSEYRTQYLQSIAAFRDECEEAIHSSGIKLCVENCDGYTDFQMEALDLLLQSPVFGLTFDIGHNHGIGGKDEPVILPRADRLLHMHMHDARGQKNHLALGTGEIDLPKYLRLAAEHHCRVVLETKTIAGLKESAEWLQKQGLIFS